MAEWKPFGTLTDEARPGDWKFLAQAQHGRLERLQAIMREMKLAMLGYPMSVRAMTPTALLAAINKELGEPEAPPTQESENDAR